MLASAKNKTKKKLIEGLLSLESFTDQRDLNRFHFTSMREELCINVFKCLLIHHTTGTFLWGIKWFMASIFRLREVTITEFHHNNITWLLSSSNRSTFQFFISVETKSIQPSTLTSGGNRLYYGTVAVTGVLRENQKTNQCNCHIK